MFKFKFNEMDHIQTWTIIHKYRTHASFMLYLRPLQLSLFPLSNQSTNTPTYGVCPTLFRPAHIQTHQTGHKMRQTRRHQGDNSKYFALLCPHPCFLPLLYFI